eukprot:COSAG01_NODE_41367_length_452_cov_1.019830_1_plen_30_part_10
MPTWFRTEGGSEAGQGETSHVSADWLEQSV